MPPRWMYQFLAITFLATSGVTSFLISQSPSLRGVSFQAGPNSSDVPIRRGVWSRVVKVNSNDLSGDAATAASINFMMQGGGTRTGTLYVGCNGKAPGGPTVELRGVFPKASGLDGGSIGGAATLMLSGMRRNVNIRTATTNDSVIVIIPVGAAESQKMVVEDESEPKGFQLLMMSGMERPTITADLPPDNDALDGVLHACNVALPPKQPKAAAALQPSQVGHLELAKVSLGMTSDQMKAALGPQFKYMQQADQKLRNMTYLGAWGTDSAYSATLIDGTIAAFNYVHTFAANSQPLQSTLIDGITAKAWPPIWRRPPYITLWVTDAQGNPKLKATGDSVVHPCAPVNAQEFGAPAAGVPPNSRPAVILQRILPRDNGPDCGTTIRLWMSPSPAGNGTANELQVSAVDDIVFHAFMAKVNQNLIQQRDQEQQKLKQVPNPF